jgi:hypothetical protein
MHGFVEKPPLWFESRAVHTLTHTFVGKPPLWFESTRVSHGVCVCVLHMVQELNKFKVPHNLHVVCGSVFL